MAGKFFGGSAFGIGNGMNGLTKKEDGKMKNYETDVNKSKGMMPFGIRAIVTLLCGILIFANFAYASDIDTSDKGKRSNAVTLPSDIIADEFFSADTGYDLDQYLFKDHVGGITGIEGVLEFYIEIGRYCGPVDGTGLDRTLFPTGGKLTNIQKLKDMGANVRFKMYVYDVDDDYTGTDYAPESDEVYINNQRMPQALYSGNNKWKIYEVEVPLETLIFPEKGDVSGIKPAKNLVQIKIDCLNRSNPKKIWAVEADWAYFQFYSFPRPIVFIHGKGDNSLGWKIYDSDGHDDIVTGGWYKWFQDEGFPVGAVDVWSEGDPFDAMSIAVPFTDKVLMVHEGDFLNNDGKGNLFKDVDEEGERNVEHTYSPEWHTIPTNNLCFSDMLSETTSSEITSYINMNGVRNIGKMFGVKKVNFVSHSTGCFYGRKYITQVMSDEKDKPKTGYENYPIVDRFIMISGPNNGVHPEYFEKPLDSILKLIGGSPCHLFYINDRWREFNRTNLQNRNVTYSYIGGYSGWRDADDIPEPLRPYEDMKSWKPEYGNHSWKLDLAEQIVLGYSLLGGAPLIDSENEFPYSLEVPSICFSYGIPHFCMKTVNLNHIPNDGLVSLRSMNLGYGTVLANFPRNHHTVRTNVQSRSTIKEALLPKKSVVRSNSRYATRSEARKYIRQNSPNVLENAKQYTYLTGTITSSDNKNNELMILGGSALIHLLWDSKAGDLDVNITDPNGKTLGNSDIVKASGEIIIAPSSFVGGVWKFQITAGNLTQQTDYKIIAFMSQCDIQLKPSTDKYDYVTGEAVALSVEFGMQEGTIKGALLSAKVYQVDDNTKSGEITLYDDGTHGDQTANDGKYSCNEWIPATKGKERFEITAIIMQDGKEFYRQATDIMINVIDKAISFNENHSDQGIDTNGNGLYDYLRVFVGVKSSVAGEYLIGAELYDNEDNFISSINLNVDLIEGDNSIEFNFDGKAISEQGANGPYHVKTGVIALEQGEIKALREVVHSSTAYSYKQFETSSVSLLGTQTDEGLDTNGNGKYEYLKWNFKLNVSVMGTYSISATLKTQDGHSIELVNDTKELSVGENSWSLSFDGKKIRRNAINGPYMIDDVSLIGGGSTTNIGFAYTTRSYNYADFEPIELIQYEQLYDTYVPPANQPPTADKLYVSTDQNKPVSVKLSGSDPDVPGMHWFILLIKPITYSVVTQPQHGTLSGTAPDLTYTPEAGYIGTDSFTFKLSDGIADSTPATVSIVINPTGSMYVDDSLALNISCAEYQGVRYGFRLDYSKIADDPFGLYWKMDISTFGNAGNAGGSCISVGSDLKINIPSALYKGITYQFSLNYNPVSSDASGHYWKMDLDTFKSN